MVAVQTRYQWGARKPRGRRAIRLPVNELWLHHTDRIPAGAVGAAAARWVQGFHMDSRNYVDVGYSWLYCPTSRQFFEGRGAGVQGAHTAGRNTVSHAVAVLGDWHNSRPPAHVVDDLAAFARWHQSQGFGPGVFRGGHRDAPGARTACPGRWLHQLIPAINDVAGRVAPAAAEEDELMAAADDILEAIEALRRRVDELERNLPGTVRAVVNGSHASWGHPMGKSGLSHSQVIQHTRRDVGTLLALVEGIYGGGSE